MKVGFLEVEKVMAHDPGSSFHEVTTAEFKYSRLFAASIGDQIQIETFVGLSKTPFEFFEPARSKVRLGRGFDFNVPIGVGVFPRAAEIITTLLNSPSSAPIRLFVSHYCLEALFFGILVHGVYAGLLFLPTQNRNSSNSGFGLSFPDAGRFYSAFRV